MKSFFRKAVIFLICSVLLLPSLFAPCASAVRTEVGVSSGYPNVSAKSAVLIDAESCQVLFEKSANTRLGMASTTKIMTALVAASILPLDLQVEIPKEAVGIEGSSVYLCEGELLSVKELLYALLLSSANDAAVALAVAASGSVDAFAKEMNAKADGLSLHDTSFENPHGLDGREHYTTARELAIITAEALKNPALCEIFSCKTAIIPQGVTKASPSPESFRRLYNHNKMLSRYEGAIGVKTGFTKKNGRCLVSAATRDGLTLIAVTLNAPDDWNDHTKLLDYGFASYKKTTIYEKGEFSYSFPVSAGKKESVILTNSEPITLLLPIGYESHTITVESGFRFATAPVYKRTTLAYLYVGACGKAAISPLVAREDIQKSD